MKKLALVTSALIAAAILPVRFAFAGDADDMAGVKATSDAFYSALAVLGDGSEMNGVFAQTPYITFVGPRSKDVIVGSEALAKYWQASNKKFVVREAKITDAHIHVTGNAAWEVGLENSQLVFPDGSGGTYEWIATNIYERQQDGTWRMVSHHVQPGAKKVSERPSQHPPGGLRLHPTT